MYLHALILNHGTLYFLVIKITPFTEKNVFDYSPLQVFQVLVPIQAAFLAIKSSGGKLLVFQSGKLITPNNGISLCGMLFYNVC